MPSAPISIIFAGTSAFGAVCLRALLGDKRFQVTLVVTQPDKPVGRKQLLTPSPVKVAATEQGVPVFQPENLNREIAGLGSARPDYLVVVAYGQIVSQAILDFPTVAPVNVHASLLPKYRGAAPIHHAILNNDTQTGVSIQRIAKSLDTGPVYAERTVTIGPRETTVSLHDRLAALAAPLLLETLVDLPKPVEQEEARATVCKKLTREDGIVDPTAMTAAQIDTKVRALVPWPGVTWNGIKLLETALEPHKDAMEVACAGNTTLSLVTVQPAGKKPMSGAEYARGQKK